MSDISETLISKSDQINADDLIGSTVTITVQRVVVKKGEQQPLDIHTHETPGKAYRPSLSMRRVIAEVWGTDSSQWTGRAMTLFRNPDIKFGKEKVGGIEISHMSHIQQPTTVALLRGKGRKLPFTVQPLQVVQQRQSIDELIEQTDGELDKLRQLYTWAQQQNYGPEDLAKITTLAESIQTAQPPEQGEQA